MHERRYRKLVEGFQFRLFMRVVAYGLIFQLTLWILLFSFYLLRQGPGDLLAQYHEFFMDNYPVLLFAFILAPAFGWDAVRFSHRVAGPIVRFRKTLQQIAADEPVRRIQLRQGDELVEMQDDFNAMLEVLVRRQAIQLSDGNEQTKIETSDAPAAAEDSKHAATGR